ncbi:MAG TPA: sigma-70 family RNA polymerase sigma factor [Thermoleophilaceae bacterium]|nr:sigma-70 family RNA polymerase sigma factor [Thermoleophilaceae bacterium]HKS78417.1 sigma-70 family RNA polymerase sigma factor [Gaiellaceae bacterium]
MDTARIEQRFRRVYEENYRLVYAYALRRLGDPSEAQDVAAEVFLVAWRRFENAPAVNEEVPIWLYAIGRRVVSNHRRSQDRRLRLIARLADANRNDLTTDDGDNLRDSSRAVLRALARLRDDDREVLLLAAWEQLSTKEIAEVLDCSENAAALRLHRARKRLTDVYKKEIVASGH